MKTEKTPFAASFAELAAPLMLSAAVVSFIAYIYACGNASAVFLFSAASLAYSAALFAIYEFLRRKGKNWLTAVTVSAIILVCVVEAGSLQNMSSAVDLGLWFMEPSRFTQVYYGNTFALILIIGFVLISSLYYFTRVRSRNLFVFLICLCPFCLFAKTFTDIPVICPIIIMTLFFFIMTMSSSSGVSVKDGKKAVVTATLAFVLAVTAIASFAPKMEVTPFREDFDEFITGVSIKAAEAADFTQFSETSSTATATDDDTVVFSFHGDDPVYIKRQCFNLYDPETNTWGYHGDENNGFNDWWEYTYFEDPSALYKAAGLGECPVMQKKCIVKAEDGFIRAIYTTSDLDGAYLENDKLKVYRTELDEYFAERGKGERVKSYRLEWFDFVIDPAFTDVFTDELAEKLTGSDDDDVSIAAESYIKTKEQAVKYNAYLLSSAVMDNCYTNYSARVKVRDLARSITAGLTRPYDMANALVQYFRSGEYIYDDEYTSADPSPDNFIFGTKRGACAAYATAMTLMCRELGLTSRYCEGFLVQEYDDENDCWIARSGDAHAFVQVWIDGYGWTDFDPTSSTTDDGFFDMTFVYVGAAAAFVFLIGALTVMLRPKIEEDSFVRKLGKARGADRFSLLYRRINSKVNAFLGERDNRLTPTDTAEKCAELFGYDVGGFVRDYEDVIYGGAERDCSGLPGLYAGFKAAYKAKLREEKKKKRKKR